MQLKKYNRIVDALTVAGCSLLAQVPENAGAVTIDTDLDLDIGYLEYLEDGRVHAREVDITGKWYASDDSVYSGRFITDALTGATPSGAVKPPSAKVQALTSPSGVAGASGVGGDTGKYVRPLEHFVDRRVAFGANWERTFDRVLRTNIGGIFSNEDDYQSWGISGSVAYDLNQKLTTVEAAAGFSYDFVGSVAGIHEELGDTNDDRPNEYKDGEKSTTDWGVGVTQVLTRASIAKISFSTGTVNGYLSDPYKVITLIDEATREPDSYFHEKRPDTHKRSSINADYNQAVREHDVITVSYRYAWDTWGINSNTIDTRYRLELGTIGYLQPHLRYYQQSAADFFYPYLDEATGQDPRFGDNPPTYASSDYRLDKMSNTTIGLKAGTSGSLGDIFLRVEIMKQHGTEGDYKDLTAKIWQVVWSVDFRK